jgi:hypothetical protein
MRLLIALAFVAGFSTAASSQVRYALTEEIRIGGEDQGPSLLQYVKGIAADARGNIFIYDRKTQDIRVFGADGKYLKTVGRLGSGPGELRDAEGIAFAPDGRLWVRDKANARFSIFKADGTFEKSWSQFFCYSQGLWYAQFDRSGRAVDGDCVVENGRGGRMALMAYHDGGRIDTLGIVPDCGDRALSQAGAWVTQTMRDGKVVGTQFRTIPWSPARLNTWSANADIYCVPNSSKYEILKFRLGGKDTARITRSAPLVPVTAFEKDSVIKQMEEKGPTGLDYSRIPATKPAIDRLGVDDRGRLWVRRTNARKEIEFDIFGADGKLSATANLGVVNSAIYHPFAFRGDHIYLVVLDSDDIQYVVRYRLTRRD